MENTFDFSNALHCLKAGQKVSRKAWGLNVQIAAQYPDANSKMSLPYIYMIKRFDETPASPAQIKLFPCDISCESIFAEDWFVVE